MKRLLVLCLGLLFSFNTWADEKILNIYAWSNEVPDFIIRQFEKETGIKINFSTYENNEIMYAKLRAAQHAGYDIVMPSSYFVDRMSRQGMLAQLDKSQLSNLKNLDPKFSKPAYDPQGLYAVPFIWGITGIFMNKSDYPHRQIHRWNDLWDANFKNKLMLLDDMREVFSMALLSLGYTANDRDPKHIKAAYLKLKDLMPNVKVFSTDMVVSIMIDEDATVGMAWNGDAYKATQENPQVNFVFPEEGFVIWVDNFAIPKNAPHQKAAYQFINFMLRPDVAKSVALYTRFPITNSAGQALLPPEIRFNSIVYPSTEVLKRGQFQTDLGEETLELYEKYWEELKMGA